MANAVDICNLALANLGDVADITSIDPPEGSAQAERCARFFPVAIRVILELHEWGFATVRERLVEHSENSRANWQHCYAMPAKCLKIIDLNDLDYPQKPPEMAKSYYDYEVGLDSSGNRCIYTNLSDARIRYINNVDEGLFPSLLVVAAAWKVASMLAGPMIKGGEGASMVKHCEEMFMYYVSEAKKLDVAQHRETRESVPDWIAAR